MYIEPDLHPLETDDQYAVLQNAVDVAAATNRPLYLPARPIHVSQPVELRSGVTIVQHGRQVRNDDPNIGLIAVGHAALTGNAVREVTLQGVNMHGQHVDEENSAPVLDLVDVHNCVFDRIHVRCKWSNAVCVRRSPTGGCANLAFRDSFLGASGYKFAADIASTNILEINRNLITGGSGGSALLLTGCHAASVRHSRIEVTNRGIEVAGNSYAVVVESNYLEAVVEGILIGENVRGCRVEGNLISIHNTSSFMPVDAEYAIRHDNGPNAILR